MKTLYLVRHAKSSRDNPMLPDKDRPLNVRGKRDASRAAKKLAKPDLILSSPARGALTTAELFAKKLDYKVHDIVIGKRLYAASPDDLLEVSAEVSYRRALELAPGNALVLHQSGFLVGNMGRFDEGIGLGRRAVEQDPLSASAYFFLGLTLWTAVRRAEAVAALRKALELAPQYAAAHAWLSIVLLEQGGNDEALAEALREPEEWGRLFALAVIHHAAGRQAESDEALHELARKYSDVAAYQVAQAHGARGEVAPAFEWLERAFTQRDPGIFWTKVDPLLRSLHADPRWEVFLRKVRLAD
jgi:tetratricopeptide (TPR) repeat protein